MLRTTLDFGRIDRSAPSLSEVLDALGVGPGCKIVETPSSWVVLDERHAYKLKRSEKPDEDGAPEARRNWCFEEQWRNERLAPGVYQGLVTLARGRDGSLRMGAKGVEVEWIVKMRRLRSEHNLKTLIRQRQVCRRQISGLARAITTMYQSGPPQHDSLDAMFARIQGRINNAARTLINYLPARQGNAVRRIRNGQRAFLNASRSSLNARVCDGRVVDGHGELLPEHVFLERDPLVIGCAAHDSRLRTLDSLDDLGLFAMECEHLGREDLAEELMATYRQLACDDDSQNLEAFYKSLRACERAAAQATARDATLANSVPAISAQIVAYIEAADRFLSLGN